MNGPRTPSIRGDSLWSGTSHGSLAEEIRWQSYHDLELAWPEWLVDDLLPKKSTICLYGKRGHGKTFLALDFALSVATGISWNGIQVSKGSVAYVLAERPDGLRRRIDGWIKSREHLLEEKGHPFPREASNPEEAVKFHVAQATMPLDREEGRDQVVNALRRLGDISLVVFDPLVSFMEGFENDARDMQKFVDGVRRVVSDRECSVLIVHHEGKGNWMNAKGARGSSALEAGMDTVLYLYGVKGQRNRCWVEVTKQREHEQVEPILVEFQPVSSIIDGEARDLGMFPEVVNDVPKKSLGQNAKTIRREAILSILRQEESGLTRSQVIARLLEQNGGVKAKGYGDTSVFNSLQELVEDKTINVSPSKDGGEGVFSVIRAASGNATGECVDPAE